MTLSCFYICFISHLVAHACATHSAALHLVSASHCRLAGRMAALPPRRSPVMADSPLYVGMTGPNGTSNSNPIMGPIGSEWGSTFNIV